MIHFAPWVDVSNNPKVLGRGDDDRIDPRACTRHLTSVTASGLGDFGGCKVDVFTSLDDEDRGGVVIRLEGIFGNGGFIPHADERESGCDVHLAGDEESACLLTALLDALLDMRSRGLLPEHDHVARVTRENVLGYEPPRRA